MAVQPASVAYSAAGSIIQVEDTGLKDIVEQININGPDGETEEIEVTSLNSPGAAREFILGLIDEGRVTSEGNFLPSDTEHQYLETVRKARTLETFKIVLPDTGAATIDFTARVAGAPISIAQGSQVLRTWNLRLSGQITITP